MKNEKNNEITTSVLLTGEWGGFREHFLTKTETLDLLTDGRSWAFDAEYHWLTRDQIADADWPTIGQLQLLPALVGGSQSTKPNPILMEEEE